MKKHAIFTVADRSYINQLHVFLRSLYDNGDIKDLDIDFYVISDSIHQSELKLGFFTARVLSVKVDDLHQFASNEDDWYGRYNGATYVALEYLKTKYECCIQMDLDLLINRSIRELFAPLAPEYKIRATAYDVNCKRGLPYHTNTGVIMFRSEAFKDINMEETYKQYVSDSEVHDLHEHPRYDEWMIPQLVARDEVDKISDDYNLRSYGNDFRESNKTNKDKYHILLHRRDCNIAHMKTKAWDRKTKHNNTFPFDLYFKEVEKVRHLVSLQFYDNCFRSAQQTVHPDEFKDFKDDES